MDFRIKQEHLAIIQSAIDLGDWLADRPEVIPNQVEAIRILQAALCRLPVPTLGLDAQYGFRIYPTYEKKVGIWRAWLVSMDEEELTLYSFYSPEPEVDIWEQTDHELDFSLKPGQPDHNGDFYHTEWIAEVSSPETLFQEGICFEIQAEVRALP